MGAWKRKWTNYSGGEVEINKYQIMLTNQFEIRVKPWGKSGTFEMNGSLQMKRDQYYIQNDITYKKNRATF